MVSIINNDDKSLSPRELAERELRGMEKDTETIEVEEAEAEEEEEKEKEKVIEDKVSEAMNRDLDKDERRYRRRIKQIRHYQQKIVETRENYEKRILKLKEDLRDLKKEIQRKRKAKNIYLGIIKAPEQELRKEEEQEQPEQPQEENGTQDGTQIE